jgi:nucleotide-binding universal stress UspA family protein
MLKEYQAKSEAGNFANKISVAVDGSELSMKAFDVAMSIRPSSDVHVTVLTVEDKAKDYLPGEMKAASLVEKYNAELASKVGSADRYEVVVQQKEKSTRDTICSFINSKEIQPITFLAVGMVGRKGKRAADAANILGSTTDMSMRQGNCATLIVKDDSRIVPNNEPAHWVVCVDGSRRADNAAALCAFLKKDADVVQHVYVATNEERGKELAAKYNGLLQLEKVGGTTIAAHILEHLAKEETKCDYLVMGADGEEAFKLGKRTIGSVSDKLVKKFEGTVLVQSHL